MSTELALGGGRVRMRLDRVDAIAGGRAVLDYKSGRPASPDWFGERPAHPSCSRISPRWEATSWRSPWST